MKRLLSFLLIICTLLLSSCGFFEAHTTDIAKYGRFKRCVSDWEFEFFPRLDTDIMSGIRYSYNADCIIDCAHEIYLEFTIEDEESFSSFLKEHSNAITQKKRDAVIREFKYDKSYTEVVIEDEILMRTSDEDELVIDHAYVRKMLYNDESNCIVFINLYVIDYWELENSTYISRFNIDPYDLLIF